MRKVQMRGRSLAGAAPDALYHGFAIDMSHDDGESSDWFFRLKSDQPAPKVIRRQRTFMQFDGGVC